MARDSGESRVDSGEGRGGDGIGKTALSLTNTNAIRDYQKQTSPTEGVVDVVPDDYSFKIYYVELWDPVYGAECGEGSNYAQVTHNTRLMVLECSNKTPNNGEPPAILKYPEGRSPF